MGEIWPDTVLGWFALLGAVSAFGSTLYGLVHQIAIKPLRADLNGYGHRLDKYDHARAELDGKQAAIQQGLALSAADRANMHETLGRLAVQVATLTQLSQTTALDHVNELSQIRERLAGIESTVGVIARQGRQ